MLPFKKNIKYNDIKLNIMNDDLIINLLKKNKSLGLYIIENNIDEITCIQSHYLINCTDLKSKNIVEQNFDKLNYFDKIKIITNPNKIDFIMNNIIMNDKLKFEFIESLCLNPHPKVINFIEQNSNKLNIHGWKNLCQNRNAIHILEKNTHLFDFNCWSYFILLAKKNIKVLDIIKKHLNEIHDCNWDNICSIEHYKAINLIEENLDIINNLQDFYYNNCWINIMKNPCAINLINKNIDKIDKKFYNYIYYNPNIINIYYQKIKFNKIKLNYFLYFKKIY